MSENSFNRMLTRKRRLHKKVKQLATKRHKTKQWMQLAAREAISPQELILAPTGAAHCYVHVQRPVKL